MVKERKRLTVHLSIANLQLPLNKGELYVAVCLINAVIMTILIHLKGLCSCELLGFSLNSVQNNVDEHGIFNLLLLSFVIFFYSSYNYVARNKQQL